MPTMSKLPPLTPTTFPSMTPTTNPTPTKNTVSKILKISKQYLKKSERSPKPLLSLKSAFCLSIHTAKQQNSSPYVPYEIMQFIGVPLSICWNVQCISNLQLTCGLAQKTSMKSFE